MINTVYITRHPFHISDFVLDRNVKLMSEIGRIVRESAEFFDVPGRVSLIGAGMWTSPYLQGEDIAGYYIELQPHILYREDMKTQDAIRMALKRFKSSFQSREDATDVIGDIVSCYLIAKKL